MSQKTISIKFGKETLVELRQKLLSNGGTEVYDSNPYMQYKIKVMNTIVSAYTTGKVVLQGSDPENVLKCIQGEKQVNKRMEKQRSMTSFSDVIVKDGMIGADEAGKGEYFGPLVTGACYVPSQIARDLINAGICDSKKIKDSKIYELEKLIRQKCICAVNVINNSEFNSQMKEIGNISEVLAIAHVRSINEVLFEMSKNSNIESPTNIMIDKFTKIESRIRSKFQLNIPLIMEEKGERYLAVACASILARVGYLKAMAEINEKYGKLLKGYTGLTKYVKEFVLLYGKEAWNQVAKTSYKTGRI